MSFDNLNINENILRGIYSHGFEKPSAIQVSAIPKMIEKTDVIAQHSPGQVKQGLLVLEHYVELMNLFKVYKVLSLFQQES